MAVARLDTPRPLSEIAHMAGIAPKRFMRMMVALDRELHGLLLVRRWGKAHRKPTYYLSIASLRKVWPEFGRQFASAEDIEDLREEITEVRGKVYVLAKDVGQIRGEVRALRRVK